MNIAKIRLFVGVMSFIALLGIQGGNELGQLSGLEVMKYVAILAVVLMVTFWPWVHVALSQALNSLSRFLEEPVVRVRISNEPRERMSGK